MLLKCACGWKGISLVPHPEDDTARCPRCNTIFHGIAAEDAILAASVAEERIVPMETPPEVFKELVFR